MEACSNIEAELAAAAHNLREEANVLLQGGYFSIAALFFAEAKRITLILIGLRGLLHMSRKETQVRDPIRPRINMEDYYYRMAADRRKLSRVIEDIHPARAEYLRETADALDNLAVEVRGKYVEV